MVHRRALASDGHLVSLGVRRLVWVLAGIFVLLWFGMLAVRPLYKADESRYGEISREMVASGDWITPRLNGFKYFEKPPLQYWATAALYKIFGVGDFTARLWTGFLGFCGLLLAFFAGNRLFGGRAGLLAAALLLASPLYVLSAQVNTLDMGLTFFTSLAMFAFAIGQQEKRPGWMLVFWTACALAVLSKGLVGIVLPFGTVALYSLVRCDRGLVRRLELLRGGALFLLVAAPWFVAVSLANREFPRFFFVQEHFQRFFTTMHHRYGPPWYFVPVVLLGAAPWLLALIAAWLHAFRTEAKEGFRPALFLALWCLTVFVFFSASSSKLPLYVLPMFPALAALAGAWLCTVCPRRGLLCQCAIVFTVALALAGLSLFAGRLLSPDAAALAGAYTPWLTTAGAVLGITSLIAFGAAWRQHRFVAVGLLAAGSFSCTQLLVAGHRVLSPLYSVSAAVKALPAPARDARIFAVQSYDHTMPWALRRQVTMVGAKDELASGISWEPEKFLTDLSAFSRAWESAPAAYAFIALRDLDSVRREIQSPMEIVARSPRYVIVRKP